MTDADGPGPTPAADPAPARRRRGPRSAFAVVVVALLLALTAGGAWVARLVGPIDASDPTPIAFEVRPGTPAAAVAAELESAGLLRDRRALLVLLTWRGDQGRIGAGLYDLRRDQSVAQLADALVRGGRPRTARVVLPEGIRAREVARRLAAAGWDDEVVAAFEASVADPLPELGPDGVAPPTGLEGYLFPATYELPVGFGAADLVGALVGRFERELGGVVRAEIDAVGLDVHAWVTLASMVQAEAGSSAEMGIIAGVFLNRLDLGMPLQSDPTVAYGLGKDLPELDFPGGDFAVDHPWNTYTRPGLPAGPIGNPGAEALAAVLAPTRLDDQGRRWLFFLHGRDDGAPVFRPNLDYDAHLRDVARYLRR